MSLCCCSSLTLSAPKNDSVSSHGHFRYLNVSLKENLIFFLTKFRDSLPFLTTCWIKLLALQALCSRPSSWCTNHREYPVSLEENKCWLKALIHGMCSVCSNVANSYDQYDSPFPFFTPLKLLVSYPSLYWGQYILCLWMGRVGNVTVGAGMREREPPNLWYGKPRVNIAE